MADGFGGSMPLYLMIAGIVAVMLLGQRFRAVGRILSFAVMTGGIALVVMLVAERGRFDPTFARIAGLLQLDRNQEISGRETRVPMASDGHFWVMVRFGQAERRMLVDSGATVTALSSETAAVAGIVPERSPFSMIIQTANGSIRAQTATAPELRIGNIVARDLPVVTSPAFGDMDVGGMNFLARLKAWRVEGRTLIRPPNHPQAR